MKNLFIIALTTLSLSVNAQSQKKEPNTKAIKSCITVAGVSLIAGSVVNVVRTYQIDTGTKKYNQTQTDLHRVSSMFYGIAGASLITICFNF